MPEGDAVRRTARRLDGALVGQTLKVAEIRVPRAATADLVGCTVLGTHVHGKHLLLRMANGTSRLTLHSHLRMDGRWATGTASGRPCAGPEHQVRVWLVGEQRQAVGLRLMEVAVVASDDEGDLIGHLGPDILAASWDGADGVRRVSATPDRGLVETLLDQRVVSGLGTMWAAEAAFTAGVTPFTAVGDVHQLDVVLARTRQRMRRAIIDDRRASRARLNIFERRTCLRCGGPVRTGRVGHHDRVTYWCPRCQSGPGPTGR
ncbi:MAG: DNA-formamidopyrimidine glycosylase family protein [Candidatus Nanopelagicales bacterium]